MLLIRVHMVKIRLHGTWAMHETIPQLNATQIPPLAGGHPIQRRVRDCCQPCLYCSGGPWRGSTTHGPPPHQQGNRTPLLDRT